MQYIEGISDYVRDHPEIQSGIDYYEMSREEKFKVWWRRYRHIIESPEMRHHITENSKKIENHFTWTYVFPGQSPLTLHWSMFTHSLNNFATEEQKAHYLPQVDNLNIIGCYA